jgi:hypothetical protein
MSSHGWINVFAQTVDVCSGTCHLPREDERDELRHRISSRRA